MKLNDNGTWEMNKNHDYHYQIQGQLRITKADKYYFIGFINISSPLLVLEIFPDHYFIHNMVEKLVIFLKIFVIPEIILRRLEKSPD